MTAEHLHQESVRPWRIALATLVTLVTAARAACACAVCGAASPTLTPAGEEAPFARRVRTSIDGRAARFRGIGAASRLALDEGRVDPGVAVALSKGTLVGLRAPVVVRRAEDDAGSWTRAAMGDAELRVEHVASRAALSRDRLTLLSELKLPTAPVQLAPSGARLPTDLQPGCRGLVPGVGARAAWTRGAMSYGASALFLMVFDVRDGPHPGDSLRASAYVQRQHAPWLAQRLALHARADTRGHDAEGELDPASGGPSLLVEPALVLAPARDLVTTVAAAFPIAQGTQGHRLRSALVTVTLAFDAAP